MDLLIKRNSEDDTLKNEIMKYLFIIEINKLDFDLKQFDQDFAE